MANCAKCGAYFYRDDVAEPWKRLCLPCWKSEHGIAGDKPKAKAQSGNDEVQKLKRRIMELQRELFIARAHEPISNGVDKAILRKMRMLCHPDKHNNSAIATEVTQYINKVLK